MDWYVAEDTVIVFRSALLDITINQIVFYTRVSTIAKHLAMWIEESEYSRMISRFYRGH